MCFSSVASFSAAAVLGTIGVVSIKKATNNSHYMFAAIPLVFGIQQAVEGTLWISLTHPQYSSWYTATMYLFLFFAQVLWSTWIPLSFLFIEPDPFRKKLLKGISVMGIFASCLLGYRLFTSPVSAEISGHHIYYEIASVKAISIFYSILYIASILLPCYLSSVRKTKTLGIILTISLLVTKLFYEEYLVSVWCFFAAVISFYVYAIVKELTKESVNSIDYRKAEHA